MKQIKSYAQKLSCRINDIGLEKVIAYVAREQRNKTDLELIFENIFGNRFTMQRHMASNKRLESVSSYVRKAARARQRGSIYPYEILRMMTRTGYSIDHSLPRGKFVEYDVKVSDNTRK